MKQSKPFRLIRFLSTNLGSHSGRGLRCSENIGWSRLLTTKPLSSSAQKVVSFYDEEVTKVLFY